MALYDLVNVFDNNSNKWLGQFMDEATAKEWLKKKGYDISEHEISKRHSPNFKGVTNVD